MVGSRLFLKGEVRFMFFMAAHAEQDDASRDMEVNSNGMIFFTREEKSAAKAMREAEIAYHRQLGIYKPTFTERVKIFLNIA